MSEPVADEGASEVEAINVIFDGPPAHESGRFVETEMDDGRGVNAGEWIERPDGLWALRITALPGVEELIEDRNTLAAEVDVVSEQRDAAVRRARKLADHLGVDWAEDPLLSEPWAQEVR